MVVLNEPVEFIWDKGNRDKNQIKHNVSNSECEEIFEDENKKMFRDPVHSEMGDRYILIGITRNKRLLFAVFTMRNNKIRIISARDLNKREKKLYD